MASIDDLPLTDEEREEEERRKRAGKPTLDEEIVRKYDTDRLSRLVVRAAGRGEALDLATRSDIERRLPGYDFSKVRVFRGPLAEEVTQRHKADAVTIANTGMILVRESPRSAPGTTSGQALLAHELTHVAQAQAGMVFAKENPDGDDEVEGPAEEMEAEVHEGVGKSGNVTLQAKTIEQVEARRERIVMRAVEMMERRHEDEMERRGLYNQT